MTIHWLMVLSLGVLSSKFSMYSLEKDFFSLYMLSKKNPHPPKKHKGERKRTKWYKHTEKKVLKSRKSDVNRSIISNVSPI